MCVDLFGALWAALFGALWADTFVARWADDLCGTATPTAGIASMTLAVMSATRALVMNCIALTAPSPNWRLRDFDCRLILPVGYGQDGGSPPPVMRFAPNRTLAPVRESSSLVLGLRRRTNE